MSNDPLKGEKQKKELKTRITWAIIISAYLGAYFGHERVLYESGGEDIISNLSSVMSDFYTMKEMILPLTGIKVMLPGALCLIPTDMGMIFVGLLFGCLYSLNQYTEYVTKGKERKGQEYGSGSFNTNYGGLINSYVMSPPLLKEAMINGEIKITYWDYVLFRMKKVFGKGKTGRKKFT